MVGDTGGIARARWANARAGCVQADMTTLSGSGTRAPSRCERVCWQRVKRPLLMHSWRTGIAQRPASCGPDMPTSDDSCTSCGRHVLPSMP
jgi:hypothetical protein